MTPGVFPGTRVAVLAAAVAVLAVPVSVLAIAIGLLWLFGILPGQRRREYIKGITQQALVAIVGIVHGATVASLSPEAVQEQAGAVEAGEHRPHGRNSDTASTLRRQ